jgi:hypothetical protein
MPTSFVRELKAKENICWITKLVHTRAPPTMAGSRSANKENTVDASDEKRYNTNVHASATMGRPPPAEATAAAESTASVASVAPTTTRGPHHVTWDESALEPAAPTAAEATATTIPASDQAALERAALVKAHDKVVACWQPQKESLCGLHSLRGFCGPAGGD